MARPPLPSPPAPLHTTLAATEAVAGAGSQQQAPTRPGASSSASASGGGGASSGSSGPPSPFVPNPFSQPIVSGGATLEGEASSGMAAGAAIACAAVPGSAIPGSPIHLAYQRAGLPLPPFPDPATFEEADWAAQGHEVRAILSHWRDPGTGNLFVRVCWEDSWQQAADFAGMDELAAYAARLQASGDSTDVEGEARGQRRQRWQRRRRRSGAASSGQSHSSSSSGAARGGRPARLPPPREQLTLPGRATSSA